MGAPQVAVLTLAAASARGSGPLSSTPSRPSWSVQQSTPRVTDDARLRRVQVFAPGEAVGLGVALRLPPVGEGCRPGSADRPAFRAPDSSGRIRHPS